MLNAETRTSHEALCFSETEWLTTTLDFDKKEGNWFLINADSSNQGFPVLGERVLVFRFLYEPCAFEFAKAASDSEQGLTCFGCDFFWS